MRIWRPADAARHVTVPLEHDDKYSRGVLGIATGSESYPGAAVLGVDAALHTGVGMVRYVGPDAAGSLVLQRRPEAVRARGRVQAWLIGSGIDAEHRDASTERALREAFADGVPVVADAGALDLVVEGLHRSTGDPGRLIITPHAGELARMLGAARVDVVADPVAAAHEAARRWDCVVLLKGHLTVVAGGDVVVGARAATPWLATAGAGDALGGVLGAMLATRAARWEVEPANSADAAALVELAASAAVVHGIAANRASGGGPFTVLELCQHLPQVIAELAQLATREPEG
ncbi:ADP-dependent NAD(P)H-hydrate dehydratase [Ruicaihuangia caeni]|uniref:ADP-dependent (S)-NAD(P)H-hydrate dehydratase n=1 Tax=Ruicaihuangia caeni TaxID=3042517 RepID=A0AAW6T1X8_9MICO|nr:ADP/ATP-dependent (S)-NAD(P)H-hydrate dehydratase [Klugiella sp. YN-L-19]MDI2097424.1 NAD(P)H-hydrate dehydratase [Klugiella sp. YN-L-19]